MYLILFSFCIPVFTYVLATQTSNIINGNISALAHSGIGLVLGGLYRIKHGPKAFIAGAYFGLVLGLIEGLAQKFLLWLGGKSFGELMNEQYKQRQFEIETNLKLENEYNPKKTYARDNWTDDSERDTEENPTSLEKLLFKLRSFFGQNK